MRLVLLSLSLLLGGCLDTVSSAMPDAGALDPRVSCTPAPCRAQVVAEHQDDAVGIAANSSHVYWAGGSPRRVRRLPTVGGEVENVTPEGAPAPLFLTLDGSGVAWTTAPPSGELWRMPLTGDQAPQRLATDVFSPAAPVGVGGVLYFPSSSTLRRMAVGGSAPESLLDGPVTAIAADDSGVYAAEQIDRRLVHPVVGGQTQVLASLPEGQRVQAAAVDAGFVYVLLRPAEGDACVTTVARVAKTGGELTPLVTETLCGKDLVVDAAHLYWLSSREGATVSVLSRIPKAGGSAELLADGIPYAWRLAQNATHVFWTEPGLGRVLRLAK
jgi:hypothetical protein